MEAVTAQTERKTLKLAEAAELIGISTKQLKNLRNEIEPILGRSLVKSVVIEGKRNLEMPVENIEIIETWRDRKDPDQLLLKYGNGKPTATQVSSIQRSDDWSFVNDEIAVDVEFVEAGDEVWALAPVSAVQIQVADRSNQVQDLMSQIILNDLQYNLNQKQLSEAELAQIAEDEKLRFLQVEATKRRARQEMQESLDRAAKAAEAAMNKQKKGGKRNANQSF